jgi:hypothetical protein
MDSIVTEVKGPIIATSGRDGRSKLLQIKIGSGERRKTLRKRSSAPSNRIMPSSVPESGEAGVQTARINAIM